MQFSTLVTRALCVVASIFFAPLSLADTAIVIDGSTTVYPITEKISELFTKTGNRHVDIVLSKSSSSDGLRRLCAGQIDIAQASRPIKSKEIDTCSANNIDFIELPVSFDAVVFVISHDNTWLKSITVAELQRLWQPGAEGTITRWQQIRPEWPDTPIKLLRSEPGSGTYDFVTEAILDKQGKSRGDIETIDNNNARIERVANDVNALTYVAFSYFMANQQRLNAVGIDDENDSNGAGVQIPCIDSIVNNTYQPLSRPLFIYVSSHSAQRPEIQKFVHYYLQHAAMVANKIGEVPLLTASYINAKKRFKHAKTGTLFGGSGARHDLSRNNLAEMSFEDLLQMKVTE